MPRVTPDSNDRIVWLLNETTGAYRNTGTLSPNSATTDLSITGSIIRTANGLFGGNCAQIPSTSNFPTGSSAARNYIAGAQTINISAPLTVSCWVYLRSYTTANNSTFIAKEYRDSTITPTWQTPFHSLGITTLTTNGGGDWVVNIATNNTTQISLTVTDFPIPLGVWSHIGITHDGSAIRAFLNGCQCIYYSSGNQFNSTAAGAISYTDGTNGFGFWKIGAITATGSANKEEPSANVQDVRIANIARPLSYFKSVYAAGALPTSGTIISNKFYKLRSYDLTCVTPTPVVWVDTQISLANVPASPCGSPSPNYTAPEVLDTWFA